MNDLNLRVAAIKLSAHPKRFTEMRDSIVKLPLKWQNAHAGYVKQFGAATNSAEQLVIVRDIFNQTESINFLADLLFACPLRHPLRNLLTRFFSGNESIKGEQQTHSKEFLITALRAALRDLESIVIGNTSSDFLNEVIVTISGCLQNFPYGRDALAHEIHCFIPLLPRLLGLYWSTISDEQLADLSPTRRNDYYMYIKILLRFHVNCMSEYKLELGAQHFQHLWSIDELAVAVARHGDTPWDVRSIAGLSIGHNARFSKDFAEYLVKCQQMDEFDELPIKAASLLVLKKSDYNIHGKQALDILKQILGRANDNRNISNLLVYMSKHLHTYSKSLASVHLEDEPLILYNQILIELMRFSIEHISSCIDTIRHMCANILRQVLQHAKAIGENAVINELCEHYHRSCMSIPALCLMLQQMVEVYGTEMVLQNCPSIHDKLFFEHLGREDSVNALFKCMMTIAHKENAFQDWHSVWCMHLVSAANLFSGVSKGIEDVISAAVKLDKQVLSVLLEQPKVPFNFKLMAMLVARRIGQERVVNEALANNCEEIRLAAMNENDDWRILALTFVVDTPRLSEPFTQFDIDLISAFLKHNANNPKAHFRQRAYGQLKKMCRRLELNLAQQMKAPNILKEDHILNRFVSTLFEMLSLNLFPSANYGRIWLSLRLLGDLIDMMERLGVYWQHRVHPQVYVYLDRCLYDSYEHNKERAVQLLGKLQRCTTQKPREILQRLLSARPPDSATGAYQLLVYCQAAGVETPLTLKQPATELPKNSPRYFMALLECLALLQTGINGALTDLIQAAKSNPLYGLLFASRLLLQQLNLKQLAAEQLWRDYINQLLQCCLDIIKIMLPVVASESPEGHLPVASTEAESNQEAKPGKEPKHEQVVLLCAWRSIKEISLILGELSTRAPLEPENKERYLLSRQQLAVIGDRFVQMLGEIKHRGAFEQAYVGFAMYCHRFWHSDEPELNTQPPIWLADAMKMIDGNGDYVPCATRRSAGMPYMVQALICTELKLGTHKMFSESMTRLLEVCERRAPGPEAVIARNHAFNIMRALFRCSELGNLVDEFVGRGIQCALDSLVAVDYAECNSASLMLSALMVRIFGVERARSDDGRLHVRNRMTGRIFFTCYPKLFDYLHDGLQQAAVHMEQSKGGQTLQLEAMLLLLSRLYPSALEGAESSLNLDKFVPFLDKICYVHDKMSRRRACHVLANFLSPTQAKERLRNLCMSLCALKYNLEQNNSAWDTNALHGQMYQVLELFRIIGWKDADLIRSLVFLLASIAVKIYNINVDDICIFRSILNTLVAITQDTQQTKYLNTELSIVLVKIYQLDHKDIYKRCVDAGISPKFYLVFVLHLQRLTLEPENLLPSMNRLLVQSPAQDELPAELHKFTIDLWLYVLMHHESEATNARSFFSNKELKYFQFDPNLAIYFEALTPVQREMLSMQLSHSDVVRKHVMTLVKQVERGPKWSPEMLSSLYTLMVFLDKLEPSVVELLIDSDVVDAEPGMSICMLRQIQQESKWQEIQPLGLQLLCYAGNISLPTQSIYLRWKASHLVDSLTVHVLQLLQSNDALIIGIYIRIVLQLLVDESDMVRSTISQMVSKCVAHILADNGGVKAVNLLPMAAEGLFLLAVLQNMQMYSESSDFLISVFKIIVEPFVGNELQLDDEPEDDGDVFDKHEVNLYCEGLRVVSEVAKAFKATFQNNEQLISAVNALFV
ncbi:thyroid adenoma-associated protein homolog [Drosophila grimshawi]|nr:thyroid adenoma-associated protein homolog [Drosophila grimshawi]